MERPAILRQRKVDIMLHLTQLFECVVENSQERLEHRREMLTTAQNLFGSFK